MKIRQNTNIFMDKIKKKKHFLYTLEMQKQSNTTLYKSKRGNNVSVKVK